MLRRSVAATLLMVAVGCGGTPGADGGERDQQDASRNQMNPAARDVLTQGGKLVWALDGAPANFNYYELDGTLAAGAWIINAIMPRIHKVDAGGVSTFDPDYLTEDPVVQTTPEMTVTYRLNPQAIWADGTPITAADFVAQWQALSGRNPAFRLSSSNGYDQIASVTQGATPHEVTVRFTGPYADWRALFSPLYPASTMLDPATFNDGWKSAFLTSGGPFRFAAYDATAKIYTLVRNERWWGEPAMLDSLVFRVVSTDAQATALANGEVDLINIGPSIDTYNRVRTNTRADIRVAGGPNYRHLTLNGASPILGDVAVRRAVAMGINRAVIAQSQLGPLPVVPEPLGNHIFMANQAGYQDNAGPLAYQPERAGLLLDSLGWTLNGTVREKAGKPLTLSLLIPGGVPVSKAESELIQNMLAQIGVKVEINTVPTDVFFPRYVTPGTFDMVLFSWLGTPFPISSVRSIYRQPVGGDIQQNYARVGSDELDAKMAEAAAALDPTQARVLANQADSLIWDMVHSLTLYQRPDLWAATRGLANIGAYGFATIRYQDIGWMQQ